MKANHTEFKSVIGALAYFVAAYVVTKDFTKSVALLVMAAALIAELRLLVGKK